jgi:hypothetical protein
MSAKQGDAAYRPQRDENRFIGYADDYLRSRLDSPIAEWHAEPALLHRSRTGAGGRERRQLFAVCWAYKFDQVYDTACIEFNGTKGIPPMTLEARTDSRSSRRRARFAMNPATWSRC